jgi:hypothetical protein
MTGGERMQKKKRKSERCACRNDKTQNGCNDRLRVKDVQEKRIPSRN